MKYSLLLLLMFSNAVFSLQARLEIGCESRYFNQPIEEAICDRKIFSSPEDAKEYFGGYIIKYKNPDTWQKENLDLNNDGIEEIMLEIHDGRISIWIVLLYENSSYRAISSFSGSEFKISNLPKIIAKSLSIEPIKFKDFKYIQITNPVSQNSAHYSYYAFNGHRYSFIGGWSWDGMGILSKEDFR